MTDPGTMTGAAPKTGRNLRIAAAAVLLLIAGLKWFFSSHEPATVIEKAYGLYSDDDGQSYFRAPLDVPPFDHNGREAAEAFVCRCGQGKPFVAYLIKYTSERRAMLATMLKNSDRFDNRGFSGMLVKKPGPGPWLACDGSEAARALALRNVQCPDGSVPDRLNPQVAQ